MIGNDRELDLRVTSASQDAPRGVEQRGVPFYVMPDGATVRIDERTAYEPDDSSAAAGA